MRKCIGAVFVASVLFLAGCCTTPRVARWEYKVAFAPHPQDGPQEWGKAQQAFLNDLGKNGWVLVSQTDGRVFYFRRPIR